MSEEVTIIKSNYKRIEWIDVYKAIAIILVVIGHSTGKYNMFIYQFHMAAFFFISGYIANLEKKCVVETIWNKVCTLLLPLTSMLIIMLCIINLFNIIGIYELFFDNEFLSAGFILKEYFFKGDIYINWLGAGWFILVIFGVSILQKILYQISKNKVTLVYIILSLLVYILGYKLINENIKMWNLDLIFIGQIFFFLGNLTNKKQIFNLNNTSNSVYMMIIIILNILIMIYFGIINPTTVDYPSRSFGSIVGNTFSALNGIIFIYILANMICNKFKYLKSILIKIGQNTLPILFLHFAMFKIFYILLYFLGKVPLEYIRTFIPTNEIGNRYWIIISVISVMSSIIIWSIITRFKIIRILLGLEKNIYNNIYDNVMNKYRLYTKQLDIKS